MAKDDGSRTIGPKLSLLVLCLVGLALGPALMFLAPDPFLGVDDGMRPSKVMAVFKLGGALIALLAAYRLITWTTYRVSPTALQRQSLFGSRTWTRADLVSAELDAPSGLPPSYTLRFRDDVVRLVARHYNKSAVEALRVFARAS
jgi:hypothetical protein